MGDSVRACRSEVSPGWVEPGWKPGLQQHEVRLRGLRPRHRGGSTRDLATDGIVGRYAEIYLHLVWGTWDRHPFLTGDRVEVVYRAVLDECAGLGAEVIAIGGMADHVHLLVRVPASLAPAALVKQVKGSTSHLINPTHGAQAPFRWQGGYGVFSVSRQHLARIRRYVLNQEEHHREGRTAPYLEPVYPPNRNAGP